MSWMQSLYETYDVCSEIVGKQINEETPMLLPVGYITISTHITVTLSGNGDFLSAEIMPSTERISAPCTEDSESRTGNPLPHALFDELKYLAGDYADYVGTAPNDTLRQFHQEYIKNLKGWCDSSHSHPKVVAIFHYLEKGRLISDLVQFGVFLLEEDGKLMDKWTGDNNTKPDVFKQTNSVVPSKMGIRFSVQIPGDLEQRVWLDHSVQEAYGHFITEKSRETRLCYLSGQNIPFAKKHPKNINPLAANAKLISGNDTSNFTFRGRFISSEQALSVGYETSQKAHQALRWLIADRGIKCGSQAIVTWAIDSQIKVVNPFSDSFEIFEDTYRSENDALIEARGVTEYDYAKRLAAAIRQGRNNRLNRHRKVAIIASDSATTGRLSITFYQELQEDAYLERIAAWHESCKWHLWIRSKDQAENQKSFIRIIGTPSVDKIIDTIYGRRARGEDDSFQKLKKNARERLLHCILDGEKLPVDYVRNAYAHASNPLAFDGNSSDSGQSWWTILAVACALIRKYYIDYQKEEYSMSLETDRTDRDYLYGRLLAVADNLESRALWETEKNRTTNALRFMNAFSQRPSRIWPIIMTQLGPYITRLGPDANWHLRQISEISNLFQSGDFESPKPLNESYLLGYFCQRYALTNKKKDEVKGETENEPAE